MAVSYTQKLLAEQVHREKEKGAADGRKELRGGGGGAGSKPKGGARKDLLVRCYRMVLSLDEVRAARFD